MQYDNTKWGIIQINISTLDTPTKWVDFGYLKYQNFYYQEYTAAKWQVNFRAF